MEDKISQEQIDAVEAKASVDDATIRAYFMRIPPAWTFVGQAGYASGGLFIRGSIQVIATVLRYEDGNIWVHISTCIRKGAQSFETPSHEELKRVKNDFIGTDAWAYQVFPDEKHYINQHPNVLHLYGLLDGKSALPDFTWGLGSL